MPVKIRLNECQCLFAYSEVWGHQRKLLPACKNSLMIHRPNFCWKFFFGLLRGRKNLLLDSDEEQHVFVCKQRKPQAMPIDIDAFSSKSSVWFLLGERNTNSPSFLALFFLALQHNVDIEFSPIILRTVFLLIKF